MFYGTSVGPKYLRETPVRYVLLFGLGGCGRGLGGVDAYVVFMEGRVASLYTRGVRWYR